MTDKAEPQPVAWISEDEFTREPEEVADWELLGADIEPLYSHATVEALRSERDALREALTEAAEMLEAHGASFTASVARAALASTGDLR